MHSGVNEEIDSEWNITTGLFGLEIFRLMEVPGATCFLHLHGGYIDTKHPEKLFCLILPNKGIMAIFVIFEISKI